MKLRKSLAAATATLVVAGSGLLSTAGTAQAAKSDCPKGYLCAWDKPHFRGKPQRVAGNNANLRKFAKFATARSMFNNGTKCSVRVWAGRGMSGRSVVFKRGAQLHETKGSVLVNGAGSNKWC